jgi:hypothetical protein
LFVRARSLPFNFSSVHAASKGWAFQQWSPYDSVVNRTRRARAQRDERVRERQRSTQLLLAGTPLTTTGAAAAAMSLDDDDDDAPLSRVADAARAVAAATGHSLAAATAAAAAAGGSMDTEELDLQQLHVPERYEPGLADLDAELAASSRSFSEQASLNAARADKGLCPLAPLASADPWAMYLSREWTSSVPDSLARVQALYERYGMERGAAPLAELDLETPGGLAFRAVKYERAESQVIGQRLPNKAATNAAALGLGLGLTRNASLAGASSPANHTPLTPLERRQSSMVQRANSRLAAAAAAATSVTLSSSSSPSSSSSLLQRLPAVWVASSILSMLDLSSLLSVRRACRSLQALVCAPEHARALWRPQVLLVRDLTQWTGWRKRNVEPTADINFIKAEQKRIDDERSVAAASQQPMDIDEGDDEQENTRPLSSSLFGSNLSPPSATTSLLSTLPQRRPLLPSRSAAAAAFAASSATAAAAASPSAGADGDGADTASSYPELAHLLVDRRGLRTHPLTGRLYSNADELEAGEMALDDIEVADERKPLVAGEEYFDDSCATEDNSSAEEEAEKDEAAAGAGVSLVRRHRMHRPAPWRWVRDHMGFTERSVPHVAHLRFDEAVAWCPSLYARIQACYAHTLHTLQIYHSTTLTNDLLLPAMLRHLHHTHRGMLTMEAAAEALDAEEEIDPKAKHALAHQQALRRYDAGAEEGKEVEDDEKDEAAYTHIPNSSWLVTRRTCAALPSLTALTLYNCIHFDLDGGLAFLPFYSDRPPNATPVSSCTDAAAAQQQPPMPTTQLRHLRLSKCRGVGGGMLPAWLSERVSAEAEAAARRSSMTLRPVAPRPVRLEEAPHNHLGSLGQRLLSLQLEGCRDLAPVHVALLRPLSCLRLLDLSWCPQVDDAALGELVRGNTALCASLRALHLQGCSGLSDHALVGSLSLLRALECLDLSQVGGGQLTNTGVAGLAGLPKLERLLLRFCTGVTDAMAASIRRMRALCFLDVNFCPSVTVHGRIAMKELKQGQPLRFLNP